MTPAEVAATLRQFNGWRRDFDDKFEQPDPHEVSEAIDAAVEMIERLEAAEKSDAESLAMYRRARDERDTLRAALQHEADCVEAGKAEIKALRAKVAEMEKQEPAGYGVLYVEAANGEEDWDSLWKHRVFAEERKGLRSGIFGLPGESIGAITVVPLYALPGAKGEEK